MSQEIDKTMSLGVANLVAAILTVPVILVFAVPHAVLHGEMLLDMSTTTLFLSVVAIVIAIVVHEGLHGIGYKLAGASWDEIEYGVKSFSPYAHCKVPLRVNGYRVAVALPGLALGILPGLVGILLGSAALTFFGAFMTSGALGDAMILWLLRDAPKNARVLDHPSKVGCKLVID